MPVGITRDNVRELVRRAEVVIDGVDVTTPSGLRAKIALHQEACRRRKPLVTGWGLAGVLAAQCFDYRLVRRIFDGQLLAEDAEVLSTWEVIFRIAPRSHIPGEMYRELRRGLGRPDYSVPQLTEAAPQFGSLAVHMVNQLVAAGRGGRAGPRACVRPLLPARRPAAARTPFSMDRVTAASDSAPHGISRTTHHR
ncbi:hypothetical protein [Streptomyces yangpuensis]|uniref:hypothetical protein n=1 Tax=Streptomyces yangpuensis TaxID=1648182 RepID=UPI00069A5280|nr:hypothetical protein [Streptomyces yangpuensis]